MKTKILIVSIFAVALLTLISFSSAVGYNVVKDTQEEIIKDEYEGYTPIALVFQLISKLRNYKDIDNFDIESDAELSDIIEKLKSFDCGCVESDDWFYPLMCILLLPGLTAAGLIFLVSHGIVSEPLEIMAELGLTFNCWWVY